MAKTATRSDAGRVLSWRARLERRRGFPSIRLRMAKIDREALRRRTLRESADVCTR